MKMIISATIFVTLVLASMPVMSTFAAGGYAIWGEFETIMDHGTGPLGHQ